MSGGKQVHFTSETFFFKHYHHLLWKATTYIYINVVSVCLSQNFWEASKIHDEQSILLESSHIYYAKFIMSL